MTYTYRHTDRPSRSTTHLSPSHTQRQKSARTALQWPSCFLAETARSRHARASVRRAGRSSLQTGAVGTDGSTTRSCTRTCVVFVLYLVWGGTGWYGDVQRWLVAYQVGGTRLGSRGIVGGRRGCCRLGRHVRWVVGLGGSASGGCHAR